MTEPSPQPTPAEVAYAEFRRSGSPRAMAAVFDATAPELLLFARRFARDAAGAEDLVQQTFLRAIERAAQFDATRQLLPWLTTILANEARMQRRRPRIDPSRLRVGAVMEPSLQAEQREAQQAMDAALAQLPANYRDVVALRLLHDVRPAGIAAALAIPVPTVKTRLHRGVRKLAASLPPGLALGAAVTLTAGRGLAIARRAVTAEIGTVSTLGWTVSGLLTMKKTVAGIAIAMLLLAVLPFVFSGDESAPAGEGATLAVATTDGAAMTGAADQPPAAPIERVAAHASAAVAATSTDAESVPVELLVRATWKSSGEPAIDVPLTLLVQPDQRLANARTDGRGEARFAQTVAARVWPQGMNPEHRAVSVQSPLAPGRFNNVQLTGEPGELEVELDDGHRVAGVVVDERDARVAGAKVWLSLSSVYPEIHATSTDAAGRFELRGLAEGFALHASAGTAVSPPLTRPEIGDAGEAVLRLTDVGDRVVVHVAERGGRPLADATVRLDTGWRVSPPPRRALLVTDADGNAVFDGLPGDDWVVEVVHVDQPPAQRRLENPGSGTQLTEVILLGESATMIGSVRSSDGSPAAGAQVILNDAASLLQTHLHAGADGDFTATRLAIGSFEAWVRLGAAEIRQRIDLHAGEQRVTFTLPGAARIAGRLIDAAGEPAAGWTVHAARIDEMGRGAQAHTDDEGRFTIGDLPDEAFRLDVRGPGGAGGHAFFDVATDGRELVYRLPPSARWQPATITGRVEGAPAGASVMLARADDYAASGTSLATDGTWTFDSLAPGRYHVGFETEAVQWWVEVELQSGQHRDLGTLHLPLTGGLEVLIANPAADPATTSVSLRPIGLHGPSRVGRLTPEAAGHWQAEALAVGTYHVIVEAPELGPTLTEVEIRAGETTTITVEPAPSVEVAFRFEPPTGTRWQEIGPRTMTVRAESTGVVVRFQVIGGSPEQGERFTAGNYTLDVETGGGFRGRAAFTVPPDGPVIVPLAR